MGRSTRSRGIQWARGHSSLSAPSRIRKSSSSATTIIGERKPRVDAGTLRRRARCDDTCARTAQGSADCAINAFTSDTIVALEREPTLQVERAPGTVLSYLAFNLRDPILRDVRVRQAIAYAIDRGPILKYIWRGFAQPALSILPPQSWAYDADVDVYPHDPGESAPAARCCRISGS